MPYRMAEYRCMLYLNYRLPIRQYVLYVGQKRLTMPDDIDEPDFRFSYTLISFSELSYRLFIDAERPEEQQLAILADLESEEPSKVLEKLIRNIDRQSISAAEKNKYLSQLRILVQLRNFTKPLEDVMLKVASFFKEENDPFFRRGEERKSYEVVKNLLLELRLSDEKAAEIAQVTLAFVEEVRADLAEKKS